MARIANDRSVVAVPKIDGINAYDFGYNIDKMEINAIRWSLLFNMYVAIFHCFHWSHVSVMGNFKMVLISQKSTNSGRMYHEENWCARNTTKRLRYARPLMSDAPLLSIVNSFSKWVRMTRKWIFGDLKILS